PVLPFSPTHWEAAARGRFVDFTMARFCGVRSIRCPWRFSAWRQSQAHSEGLLGRASTGVVERTSSNFAGETVHFPDSLKRFVSSDSFFFFPPISSLIFSNIATYSLFWSGGERPSSGSSGLLSAWKLEISVFLYVLGLTAIHNKLKAGDFAAFRNCGSSSCLMKS